jgi:hypothetical protein
MPSTPQFGARRRLSAPRAILLGGLVVGALDGLDAVVFFGFRGVRPVAIFQSIASGLLGRAAFRGGLRTALLGACLHFFIATVVVLIYYVASKRLHILTRQAVVFGILYGIAVYFVMNRVVVPLSAASSGGPVPLAVLANGLLIHAFGVGLPSALFARAALGSGPTGGAMSGGLG